MPISAFPKFLKHYLIITGVLSLVVLVMPELVLIGLHLLIVPGLILGVMPTAFLWGLIYALSWVAIRTFVDKKMTSLLAFPATALLLWGIPQPSRIIANSKVERYKIENIKPGKPVPVAGNVRIDSPFPLSDDKNRKKLGYSSLACDYRCIALLFEPGVTSVTVNRVEEIGFDELRTGVSQLHKEARTYRLLPKAQCGTNSLIPDFRWHFDGVTSSREDTLAASADWVTRLTSDVCLVGGEPLKTYDLLLRTGTWYAQPSVSRISKKRPLDKWPLDNWLLGKWSLGAGYATSDYAEIRNGKGEILFRQFAPRASALAVPFYIKYFETKNYNKSPGSFGLDRLWIPKKMQSRVSGERLLFQTLDIRPRVNTGQLDKGRLLQNMRTVLEQMIADSSQPAENLLFYGRMYDYFDLLEKLGATDTDARIIATLVADSRLDDLEDAYFLPRILPAKNLEQLTPAILRKLSSIPVDRKIRPTILGRAIFDWPDGAFASADAETLALLNDPAKRRRAPGLIARQADRGAAAVPLLVSIINYHVDALRQFDGQNPALTSEEKHHGFEAHGSAVDAALIGLCKLGGEGHAALSALTALENSGKLYRDSKSTYELISREAWDRTLARLGKPVADFRKPAYLSGDDESYRRKITEFLTHFDAKKNCGRV